MKSETKTTFLKVLEKQQGIINSLCAVYYNKPEDRKDAKQDIVLQLWKSWPSFRNESQVSTWIYRIGLNTLLNKKRKEDRRPALDSLSDLQNSMRYAVAQSDDDLQQLKQIISRLEDLDKGIVVLHLEGYQNKEIAQMLDLSASNVSTRLNRIKSKLKVEYQRSSYVTG